MNEFITNRTFKPIKIAFVFNKGRLSRLSAARISEAPKEFFLGALELEQKGHHIGYFEVDVDWAPGIIIGVINLILRKGGFMPEKTYGSLLIRTWALLGQLKKYDCIVGTTSGLAFALGFWRKIGFLRIPIVAIHCGLVNNSYSSVRRLLTATLLRCMHTMLYGEREQDLILNLCPGIGKKISINQFGVDTDFWHPGKKRGDYILAIGNDGRRDFDLLFNAAKSIPYEIRIVTSLQLPEKLPENITVLRGSWHSEIISDEKIRSLYQEALCVVVPLKETFQPSGQSVCLQAMACGTPVVLTKTEGLWSSSMMKDHENVLFIKPYDRDDLIAKVNRLSNDMDLRNRIGLEARNTVCHFATTDSFAKGIEDCCKKIIYQERRNWSVKKV